MLQEKQISQFINALLADDMATADKHLQAVVSNKIVSRIQEADEQLGEGFFDRLGAKASGTKASIGAKAQNFMTGIKGGAKAAGQVLTGNMGKAALTLGKTAGAMNKNDPQVAQKAAKVQSISGTIENDLEKLFPGDPAIQKVLAALGELGKTKPVVAKTPKAKVSPAIPAPSTSPSATP